jgi:hypothetical protein
MMRFEAEVRKRLGAPLILKNDRFSQPFLALGWPIWTEDADFFGGGVATWASASIDIFLAQ